MSKTSKPPIIFSPRWWKMLFMILGEARSMRKAMKARRSSGHLDNFERSREFHALRTKPGSPRVTVVRGTKR